LRNQLLGVYIYFRSATVVSKIYYVIGTEYVSGAAQNLKTLNLMAVSEYKLRTDGTAVELHTVHAWTSGITPTDMALEGVSARAHTCVYRVNRRWGHLHRNLHVSAVVFWVAPIPLLPVFDQTSNQNRWSVALHEHQSMKCNFFRIRTSGRYRDN